MFFLRQQELQIRDKRTSESHGLFRTRNRTLNTHIVIRLCTRANLMHALQRDATLMQEKSLASSH